MNLTLQIIPNPLVVIIQLAPFLVTAWGLYVLIFKPTLAYLDARYNAIDGGRKRAKELEASVATRLAEYEASLNKARAEVIELRAARRADALARYGEILGEARAGGEARIAEALVELNKERETSRAILVGSARALGSDIANQVLGRTIAAG